MAEGLAVELGAPAFAGHRRRLEGRTRGIPGWHEVGWDHVERMRVEYPPLTHEHLTVDAMDPAEQNLRLVREYLRRSEDQRRSRPA